MFQYQVIILGVFKKQLKKLIFTSRFHVHYIILYAKKKPGHTVFLPYWPIEGFVSATLILICFSNPLFITFFPKSVSKNEYENSFIPLHNLLFLGLYHFWANRFYSCEITTSVTTKTNSQLPIIGDHWTMAVTYIQKSAKSLLVLTRLNQIPFV